jgi:hypothetical protein
MGCSGHYVCPVVQCDLCGAVPEESPDEVPLTWVTAVERGRTKVFCEQCARENLRSIESKLDSEWW